MADPLLLQIARRLKSYPALLPPLRWARQRSSRLDYLARSLTERMNFQNNANIHDLPPIFHYWANAHLRPLMQTFGFPGPDDFFVKYLLEAVHAAPAGPYRFISIGAGNCDIEVNFAAALRANGIDDFVIECLDLNTAMLERGRVTAEQRGVAAYIAPQQADFNRWQPTKHYDAVIACQSLHHVLNLEGLFAAIRGALKPHGLFLASDMIGRNGHLRWPEATAIVQEFWQELPPHYRFNQQLQRQEDTFLDWDCSDGNFEGIRAQDILPLLTQYFEFDLFVGFSNIIMPFIDRGFGHNFNAEAEWDRNFIDRVHARDEAEMLAGHLKPTQMLAALCSGREGKKQHWKNLSPEFCIRPVN